MPYDSCQSKIVKRGIATLCLGSTLEKSCTHMTQASFGNQIQRLLAANFPDSLLTAVSEALLRKAKGDVTRAATGEQRTETVRPAVIPYVHKVSHNLKKVAGRYGVPVAFSAPIKLAQLCPRTAREVEASRQGCGKKHATMYGRCAKGVVYEIPFSCGNSYIGITGRCINERVREHELNLMNDGLAHLPMHCKACGCVPRFNEFKILGRSRYKTARELMEAYYIKKKGERCISEPSVTLYASETRLFDCWIA